jgi:hypothetical protein
MQAFNEFKKESNDLFNIDIIYGKRLRFDFDQNNSISKIIVFESSGNLTISKEGVVARGTFKVLNKNSIIINDGDLTLYDLIFFDTDLLILKKSDTDFYKVYSNEEISGHKIITINDAINFLNRKYFVVEDIDKDKIPLQNLSVKEVKRGYNFKMGDYIKYLVEIDGEKKMFFYQKRSNNKYYLYHKDLIILFNKESDCLGYLLKYSNEID